MLDSQISAALRCGARTRALTRLTLVCLLAASCNTDVNSAMARDNGATPGAVAGPRPSSPSIQRRRDAIARLLEAHILFRTYLDDGAPKLSNTKFAGPFEYKGGLFSQADAVVYCAYAKLELWPIPDERTAAIRVEVNPDGSERLNATIGIKRPPAECLRAKYEPFPELTLSRQKRRQALGKAD
jgi:hypothetical protein